MRILHVALADEWAAGAAAGEYRTSSRGRTLDDEGFIHASTSSQVQGVLDAFYGGLEPTSLQLLVLDVDALDASGSSVRWDPVPGAPDPFPHVYGPVVPAAVVAVLPVGGSPGTLTLPDLTGYDVARSTT